METFDIKKNATRQDCYWWFLDGLYYDIDLGTIWHCVLVSGTTSQSIGLVLGCALLSCWMALCVHYTNPLIEFYFIIIVIVIGICMACFIINYTFRLSVAKEFWFCKCAALWTFPLNIGLNKLHGPGFATDSPCAIWCRGSTTCLLYVGPRIEDWVWNNSGYVIVT